MWRGLVFLTFPALGWAQDTPAYQGHPVGYWVDRFADGDPEAEHAVLDIGAPSVPFLLKRLANADPRVAERLESILTALGAQAGPALLEQIQAGQGRTRLLALRFVFEMERPPPDLERLLPGLLTDPDQEMRVETALRLCDGGLQLPGSISALLEGLHNDSPDTRAAAASHLGSFQQEGARIVPALIAAAKDADRRVRQNAYASLGVFWAAHSDARATTVTALKSDRASDRADAVIALGQVAPTTPEVVALCLKAADDGDAGVRERAIATLRCIWEDSREPLGNNSDRALSHSSPEVRKLACETVRMSESAALPGVLARLEDTHDDVRIAALDAIGRIGDAGPSVRSQLRRLLVDRRADVATRAAWTLIGLDVEVDEAARFLVGVGAAVDVAAILGPRAHLAAPALRRMLNASPAEDVGDVAWALYVVTGDRDPPLAALRRQLEHGGSFAKLRACICITWFGPAAAELVPVLAPLLDHPSADVRRYAATALGSIGPASKSTVPRLIELLDDHEADASEPVYHVCRHAAAALALLDVDNQKIKDLLTQVVDEWDPNDGKTRPGALRYFWVHGLMAADDLVARCADSLQPPNWQDSLPIIRLLAEIGPPAASAIPALADLEGCRYEIRTAAQEAIRRIRSK